MEHFDSISGEPDWEPRYNVAPTQPVPVIRQNPEKPVRELSLMRWGLIPSWAKAPSGYASLINARSETASTKPAFADAFKHRRCLIPADGFYEWKATGTRKQPYYVRAKSGQPLAFAGLWETWTGPNGEELETAAIATTRANRALADIHERMPVIVPPEAFNMWLECTNVDAETAGALIAPASENLLEVYEVSTAVNRTANDNPKLVERNLVHAEAEPAAQLATPRRRAKRVKKDDGQGALF